MTREEKIKKKQLRSFNRKAKRIEKDKKYLSLAHNKGQYSISIGRHISNGTYFECEMGYPCCESRGYCNGDC